MMINRASLTLGFKEKIIKTVKTVAPLALFILFAITAGAVVWAQEQDVGQQSLFARTVDQLTTSSPEQSALFASIALSQLADAYYQEADLVHDAHRKPSKKQQRWASSVMSYAQEISLFNDRIIQGSDARVILYPHTDAVVKVDNKLITLSHPRMDQQSAFEESVLQRYCELVACVAPSHPRWPPAEVQPRVAQQLNWRFTEQGANCSQQGLTINFGQGDGFKALRHHCAELFGELDNLLSAMQWHERHGVVIDWNRVSISEMHNRSDHVVVLNGLGDTAVANIPHLYSSQALFNELTPWLQARLDGVEVIYEIQFY